MVPADKMDLMAIGALFDLVITHEIIKVSSLLRRKKTRSLAERTGVFQGGQERRANKLGAIRHPAERFNKSFAGLKSNDIRLLWTHAILRR